MKKNNLVFKIFGISVLIFLSSCNNKIDIPKENNTFTINGDGYSERIFEIELINENSIAEASFDASQKIREIKIEGIQNVDTSLIKINIVVSNQDTGKFIWGTESNKFNLDINERQYYNSKGYTVITNIGEFIEGYFEGRVERDINPVVSTKAEIISSKFKVVNKDISNK